MKSKGSKAAYTYRCADCGSTKEFAQRPAMAPTCCGNVMQMA
jgi:hypothetical protein